MKTLALKEIELAYDDVGGPESASRPLVLVHDFSSSRSDFRERLPELARLGRTIALDLRGHGQSTNTGNAADYGFAPLVDDIRGFLAALEVRRCDLFGHGLGGMLALRLTMRDPKVVASLLLAGSSSRGTSAVRPDAFELGASIGRRDGMAALFDQIRAAASIGSSRSQADQRLEAQLGTEEYWARRREKLAAMDPEAFAALGPRLGIQEPLTSRLGEIQCPTVVLVGRQDEHYLAGSRELADQIPGASLVVFEGAAHSPHLEEPSAWVAAIREHLTDVRS